MITVSPEYLPTGKQGGKIPGINGQREEKTGDKGPLVLCEGWAGALVLCGGRWGALVLCGGGGTGSLQRKKRTLVPYWGNGDGGKVLNEE